MACFLFYDRGKLFFKIKNYEKAINDLKEFISKSKNKSNLYRCYVESLFLKIIQILQKRKDIQKGVGNMTGKKILLHKR